VGKGFALKASKPGSYVFVKAHKDPAFYNVPISVMKSDIENGALHLAIKTISAKTKLLAKEEKELTLRGIYRNGILNIRSVIGERGRAEKESKILLITKGVGFAPAVLLSEWAGSHAKIDFFIDAGKIGNEIVLDYTPKEAGGTVRETDLREIFESEAERNKLKESIESANYDAVLVLTSDYYIKKMRDLVAEIKPPPKFACGNNFQICCGEGICGACSRVNPDGITFKMCKCNAIVIPAEYCAVQAT
jgi:NAD(P)H-flavin reductase